MTRPGPTSPALSFGQIVGRNVRALRDERGLTQHEFLAGCQALGLRWPRSRLVLLESDRVREVTVTELVVFAGALDARIDQMLGGSDEVSLPEEGVTCNVNDVRTFFTGGPPVSPHGADNSKTEPDEAGTMLAVQQFERELAARFDVPVREIHYAATKLYQRPVVAERDRRVAEFGILSKEERTARRGHVTRALTAEIEAELREKGKIF